MQALFRYYSQALTDLIENEGIVFRAFADSRLPHFTQLSKEEQNAVVENIKLYCAVCAQVQAEGDSLSDNHKMVETALQVLGMTVAPEDLALLNSEMYIEMYALNHVQIFRSFNLLESTTYTFEDLTCRKWYHLYERAPGEHEKTVEKIMAFVGQKNPVRIAPGLGIHRIQEKATLEKLLCITEIEWLIPLWKNGKFAGMMTFIRNHNPPAKKL